MGAEHFNIACAIVEDGLSCVDNTSFKFCCYVSAEK